MRKIITVCCALLVSFTLIIIGCGEDEGEEAEVGDVTPPEVENVIVAGDTSAAATNGPIMIVFSKAVNASSVHTALSLTPQVSGSTSYSEETRTLTLDPDSDLQAHTKYSLTVSNVEDKAGNVMEPFTFEILTSEKDTNPPTIKKTIPSDGDEEVSTVAKFNVEFGERIDQTKFLRDLSLKPDTGVAVDRWIFTWSEHGKQVEIFIPLEKGLEPEKKFTLRVGASSVVDLVGNVMERSLEVKFTTAERPYEEINPESQAAIQQGWLYIIWKDPGKVWHIIWGGSAPAGAVKTGQGTIFSKDGSLGDVTEVGWEAGDTWDLKDDRLTFRGAVNGTGGTDGLTFRAKGKTVTFQLLNAKPEWIFIGGARKNPETTTFTLLNED